MINIEPIEAFSDNYIWLVTTNEGSIVIDPGESSKTIELLKKRDLNLKAILITHHHFDHTGGIDEVKLFSSAKVYGPKNDISSIDVRVEVGQALSLIGIDFEIIELPGHTMDHIAFYTNNNGNPLLFCGDTLFAGGCGRVFEGTFEQMHESLMKLKSLPANTKVYSGHEYTTANLSFAKEVEPLNKNIISRYNEVLKLRKEGIPTLPTTIEIELKTNPFFRCDVEEIQDSLLKKFNIERNEQEIFKALREWKDNF
jgi:hydroxyacylglutathione hydrolase